MNTTTAIETTEETPRAWLEDAIKSATARATQARTPSSVDASEDEAYRMMDACYMIDVYACALDVIDRCTDGQDFGDAVTESVDGTQRTIYTSQARVVLLVSGNRDAYSEEMGEETNDPSIAAAWAMMADVREALDAASFDPDCETSLEDANLTDAEYEAAAAHASKGGAK